MTTEAAGGGARAREASFTDASRGQPRRLPATRMVVGCSAAIPSAGGATGIYAVEPGDPAASIVGLYGWPGAAPARMIASLSRLILRVTGLR